MPRGPVKGEAGHSGFPIVGSGASAGGYDALRQLLKHVRHDMGDMFHRSQEGSRQTTSKLALQGQLIELS